jgi:hypothetical protein
MNKKYSFFQTLIIIVLVNLIVFGAVWAWTEPNNPPPGGNVAVPINTGNIYQEKLGGLWLLNGLGVDNKLIVDGNVGIGTTNPGAKLHIAGLSSDKAIRMGEYGTNGLSSTNFVGTHYYWNTDNLQIGLRDYGSDRKDAVFNIEQSSDNFRFQVAGNDKVFIKGTGNVGIGTTGPGAKLEVAGQVKITGGSPGAGKVLTSNAAGLASWQAAAGGITCADCDARFVNTTGDTMSGNLDIPNNALFIGSGNARIKFYDSGSRFYMAPYDDGAWQWGREFGYNADTNRWYFDNDVQAHAFYYSSDKAFKTDILHLEDGLDKILSLQGVSFNWKENNEPSIGLIAQDVEKIFPEAVSGKEGEKAVNYGVLVAPLIEAVKEQQKEIEYLKTEIEELKGIIK